MIIFVKLELKLKVDQQFQRLHSFEGTANISVFSEFYFKLSQIFRNVKNYKQQMRHCFKLSSAFLREWLKSTSAKIV